MPEISDSDLTQKLKEKRENNDDKDLYVFFYTSTCPHCLSAEAELAKADRFLKKIVRCATVFVFALAAIPAGRPWATYFEDIV